jgi:multiple sugar transport system permease protein
VMMEHSHKRPRARQVRKVVWWVVRYLLILLILAFFLFPIYWVVATSIKPPDETFHIPVIYFPNEPTANHWLRAFGLGGGGRALLALRDSLIITCGATLLTLLIGSSVAYSMARFETGGSDFSFFILSQRMLPPAAVILPIFLLFRYLKLVDTHLGLILLYTVFNLPLCIWMLRSYFIEISAEIEESAMIDGASRVQVLHHVTIPLAASGLAATTIFVFIFSWTEFLFALVLSRNNVLTLPVMISRLVGVQTFEWGVAAVTSIVATVPILILGLSVRHHFVRGITMGAVRE